MRKFYIYPTETVGTFENELLAILCSKKVNRKEEFRKLYKKYFGQIEGPIGNKFSNYNER